MYIFFAFHVWFGKSSISILIYLLAYGGEKNEYKIIKYRHETTLRPTEIDIDTEKKLCFMR